MTLLSLVLTIALGAALVFGLHYTVRWMVRLMESRGKSIRIDERDLTNH